MNILSLFKRGELEKDGIHVYNLEEDEFFPKNSNKAKYQKTKLEVYAERKTILNAGYLRVSSIDLKHGKNEKLWRTMKVVSCGDKDHDKKELDTCLNVFKKVARRHIEKYPKGCLLTKDYENKFNVSIGSLFEEAE